MTTAQSGLGKGLSTKPKVGEIGRYETMPVDPCVSSCPDFVLPSSHARALIKRNRSFSTSYATAEEMTDGVRRRVTAYERVLGPVAKPVKKDELEEEETVVLEKTRTDIFFDALHALINNFVFLLIVNLAVICNIIALILLTFPEHEAKASYFFIVLDSFFLAIYVAEAVLKIVALGFNYFRSGWNILDFFIVLTSIIDYIINFLGSSIGTGTGGVQKILRIFRALRALRALRMLKMITLLENLQVIVSTVLKSVGSMAVVCFLMLLFLYMFAVMGRMIYADKSNYYFGNLFRAVTTMFQLLTFDDWFSIYDDVNSGCDNCNWHFIIFCIIYSLVEYFIFLNLFMAVLVDNFEAQQQRKVAAIAVDAEMEELKNEEPAAQQVNNPDLLKTQWPQGRPTLHYNPYLEDLGHLPLEERIIYVQFYNTLCSLDYHSYVQKQNFLMMHRLLDKCQDPRLLMNTQTEHE